MTWSETLRATGIVEADLTYELTEEGIRLLEPPYKIYRLGMDSEMNWRGAGLDRNFRTGCEKGAGK